MTKSAREVIDAELRDLVKTGWVADSDVATFIMHLDSAGYVIVPKEPSEEMVTAGFRAGAVQDHGRQDTIEVYRAMLSTASREGE